MDKMLVNIDNELEVRSNYSVLTLLCLMATFDKTA